MQNPTCVFDLSNEGEEEIFLYLEPEGAEFVLRPNCKVEFHLSGANDPIEMNIGFVRKIEKPQFPSGRFRASSIYWLMAAVSGKT
jgi:hypothetical protein